MNTELHTNVCVSTLQLNVVPLCTLGAGEKKLQNQWRETAAERGTKKGKESHQITSARWSLQRDVTHFAV